VKTSSTGPVVSNTEMSTLSTEKVREALAFVRKGFVSSYPSYALLISLNFLFAGLVFGQLQTGKGMLVFGDLGGQYLYGPPNPVLLMSLSVYSTVQQFSGYIIGPVQAQNFTYLASSLLPSVALLFFLNSLNRRTLLNAAISFCFLTPVNPVILDNLLGGGWEFDLWLFFTLLGMAILYRTSNGPNFRMGAVWSGILIGLGLSQVGIQWGDAVFALQLDVVLISPVLARFIWLNRRGLRALGTGLACGLSLVLLTNLYLIAAVYYYYSLASGNSAILGASKSTLLGNLQFTFSQFGFANALLNAPLVVNPLWNAVPASWWTILVVSAVVLGAFAATQQSYQHHWFALSYVTVYLCVALFFAGVSTGLSVAVYLSFKPLDFLDDPVYFLYLESTILAILLSLGCDSFAGWLGTEATMATGPSRSSGIARRAQTVGLALKVTLKGRLSKRRVGYVTCIAVVLLLAAGTTLQFGSALSSSLDASPATQGESPYAPSWLSEVHDWYIQSGQESSGSILVLPDSYIAYNQIWGFIPRDRVWIIPEGPILNPLENTSLFVSTMNLLADGEGGAFAYALAVSGVQQVVLLNTSTQITIIPPYMESPGVQVPESDLESTLSNASEFHLSYQNSHFIVYSDSLFSPPGAPISTVATFNAPSVSTPPASVTQLLKDPNFNTTQNYSGWARDPPQSVLLQSNQSVGLTVDPSIGLNYGFMSDDINLQPYLNWTSEAGSGLSSNSSEFQVTLVATSRYSVSSSINLYLQIYWYNTSNDPAEFSRFDTTTLGPLSPANVTISAAVVAPASATFARFIYYASPVDDSSNATAYVSQPSFDFVIRVAALAENASVDSLLSKLLVSEDLLNSSALEILPPISGGLSPSALSTFDEVYFGQSLLFQTAEQEYTLDLCTAMVPTCSRTGNVSFFVTGASSTGGWLSVEVGSDLVVNRTFTVGGAWFEGLTLLSGSSDVTLFRSSTVTVSIIGFVVSRSDNSEGSTTRIPLPIGELSIIEGPNSPGYLVTWIGVETYYQPTGAIALLVGYAPGSIVISVVGIQLGLVLHRAHQKRGRVTVARKV
jgi:hypothetical protein